MRKIISMNMGAYLFSFNVGRNWDGVSVGSNWLMDNMMSKIIGKWSMMVDSWSSSISYYWSFYFYWLNFNGLNFYWLYSWESIGKWSMMVDSWGSDGNGSLTNRIDKSILVNILRETFEVEWTSTSWGSNKITPCWSQWAGWEA
jgi:hypothetical protein